MMAGSQLNVMTLFANKTINWREKVSKDFNDERSGFVMMPDDLRLFDDYLVSAHKKFFDGNKNNRDAVHQFLDDTYAKIHAGLTSLKEHKHTLALPGDYGMLFLLACCSDDPELILFIPTSDYKLWLLESIYAKCVNLPIALFEMGVRPDDEICSAIQAVGNRDLLRYLDDNNYMHFAFTNTKP